MAKAAPGDTKQVLAVWNGALEFEATANSGFAVRMDGDAQTAVSPLELVLMGLAGCTGGDVAAILKKKRQKLTGLEVKLHARRAAEHPRKFTEIEMTFVVTGRKIDPDAVRRAIELSETKYCSVSANLRCGASIKTQFEIHEAAPVPA